MLYVAIRCYRPVYSIHPSFFNSNPFVNLSRFFRAFLMLCRWQTQSWQSDEFHIGGSTTTTTLFPRISFRRCRYICFSKHYSCLESDNVVLFFSCGRQGSSVSSVRWCSATNQRSALTTTPRMRRATTDQGIPRRSSNVTFAVESLRQSAVLIYTCELCTKSVTSRLFNVRLVCVCSSAKTIFKLILSRRTKKRV